MLDSNDIATVRGIRLLFDEARQPDRPLAFWVGAGASAWCGYPLWSELAERIHSDFVRHEPGYEAARGLDLLEGGEFPRLFQMCRDQSSQRFYRVLSDALPSKPPTPVYRRFASAVDAVRPLFVLTTNVDDLLENSLSNVTTVGRNDLERALALFDRGESFVCKLHGSLSDIRSTVFTSDDYERLSADARYLAFLARVLARVSILFVGYSVQDEHVLSVLQRNNTLADLFGDGPHFALLPRGSSVLPSSVRVLRYTPDPHKDHRSTISVIEEIQFLHAREAKTPTPEELEAHSSSALRSAHLLFHIFPPGTWTTSETFEIEDTAGETKQLVVGPGFSDSELPASASTAMHDVLVGLLCFDQLVAPIQALSRLHDLIGAELFWRLVSEDVLAFVDWQCLEGVIFPDPGSVASGDLGSLTVHNPDFTEQTVGQLIRRQLKPGPGRERQAEEHFASLESRIRRIKPEEEGSIPDIVRSLLLRPSIRGMLGISGGTPLNSLARWQAFPVLRLASVAKIGAACSVLGIASAKLDFGASKLAGPAFSSAAGNEWADDTASYVLCGRFAADVGTLVLQDRSILNTVVTFRATGNGEALRRDVFAHLAAREGAEVDVAVNSALRAAIPSRVLQRARDEFVSLSIAEAPSVRPAPALWNDMRFAEGAIARWRQRSKEMFQQHCQRLGVDRYSACPCGSGERVRFCCEEALGS